MTDVALDIPINPDDPQKSVSGRLFYLISLSEYCEGFWESLRDDVLYPCEFFRYRAEGQLIPAGSHESAQVHFDEWIMDYQIKDEWIIKAAHFTLSSWAVLVHHLGRAVLDTGQPLQVWYGPNDASLAVALSPFEPVFDPPYPAPLEPLSAHDRSVLDGEPVGLRMYEAAVTRESVLAFKKRLRAQFDSQLAEYAKRCETNILEQKNMRRDAAWTALYQAGQTPKAIEAWEFERSGETFSQARIQQAVKKFANAIGLTLRKPKAGPKPKGILGQGIIADSTI